MKRLLLSFLAAVAFSPLALVAGERANTVLIHPGEVVYAKFTQKGKKLTLVSTAKEKDETAQVIVSLSKSDPKDGLTLQVENKFSKDLVYKAEMRSLILKRHAEAPVVPVVTGKMSREQLPPMIEELALFRFELIL